MKRRQIISGDLRNNMVVSSLDFLIVSYMSWRGWFRELEPQTGNRHNKKKFHEDPVSLTKRQGNQGPSTTENLLDHICPTPFKHEWKNLCFTVLHGFSGAE